MCSGPTQGKIAATLCRLRGASVLELGTFCGYGTLWLSSAAKEVITVDRDERAANIAKEHFRDVPADWGAVRQVVADRGQYLSTCKDGPFDLVYVDCDKKGYAAVFDALLDTPGLLSENACLVFDNTLWKGRVAEGTTGMSPSEEEAILADAEARGDDPEAGASRPHGRRPGRSRRLREFNVKLRTIRVDSLVLPLCTATVATLVSRTAWAQAPSFSSVRPPAAVALSSMRHSMRVTPSSRACSGALPRARLGVMRGSQRCPASLSKT